MSNDASSIVQKLWNYCDVLQDDGVSYGDYTQQLTNILFLKMADEQTKPPFNKKSIIPKGYDWESLLSKKGHELETHYRHILEELGKQDKLLGLIYRKSKNQIDDPAKLSRLIKLINEESWFGLTVDVKGEIYEGLLEKNADSSQKGAGQYFTPRALIAAMVDVTQPKPKQTIGDPSCGTGGFFLATHDYIDKNYNLDPDEKKFLKEKTFHGWDIVPEVTRLCAMNMYLHGIGSVESQVQNTDSLIGDPGDRFDVIMTNPPFGKKSTVTIFSEEGKAEKESMSYERDDFWTTTSNKQLNFIQHIKTLLKVNGKCTVVVPDNVLFEGGAGEIIRKKLLEQCDLHTMLRLPTGIFYAGGVKANVLFFDKKPAREDGKAWTEKLWIYDFRTNMHFTQKEKKLTRADLDDFVKCYNTADISKRKEDAKDEKRRWRSYTYDEIIKRDKTSLDIFWLKDDSLIDLENLPEPDVIALEISDNLESALESVTELIENLKNK
jgi:type I restriction enzyme M protein